MVARETPWPALRALVLFAIASSSSSFVDCIFRELGETRRHEGTGFPSRGNEKAIDPASSRAPRQIQLN